MCLEGPGEPRGSRRSVAAGCFRARQAHTPLRSAGVPLAAALEPPRRDLLELRVLQLALARSATTSPRRLCNSSLFFLPPRQLGVLGLSLLGLPTCVRLKRVLSAALVEALMPSHLLAMNDMTAAESHALECIVLTCSVLVPRRPSLRSFIRLPGPCSVLRDVVGDIEALLSVGRAPT